jgi:hypothetical protein
VYFDYSSTVKQICRIKTATNNLRKCNFRDIDLGHEMYIVNLVTCSDKVSSKQLNFNLHCQLIFDLCMRTFF